MDIESNTAAKESDSARDKRQKHDNPGLVLDLESEIADQNSTSYPPRRAVTAPSSTSSNIYRDTLCFNDGKKKIDLMLVYEDDLDFTKEQQRKSFLQNLVTQGLQVKMENENPDYKEAKDTRTHFVKVHAPWPILAKYAEMMNMKMPIKDRPTARKTDENQNTWWRKLRFKIFDYNHERIPAEPSFFLAPFSRHKEECFLIKDRKTFFSSAQRSQIVWKILTRTRFNEEGGDKPVIHQTGIQRLLNDKTFQAAFPLHDGPYDEEDASGEPNDRRLLYTEWALFGNWYKKQPLWLIRKYFGDKVGLYFAWLGFYTTMLIPASIVGIFCFVFGALTVGTDYNTPSREVWDKHISGKTIMCPLCGQCDLWELRDESASFELTYLVDNPATVFFAIFMAFWATSFLEFWKRKHAVLSWEWDLHDYKVDEEPRPEFGAVVAKPFRINPVTETPEQPYQSAGRKAVRMLIVSSLVFLLLFCVAFVILGIFIYRLVMISLLYRPRDETLIDKTEETDTRVDFARPIASLSAAIFYVIFVVILHNIVYSKVAIWLTNSEYPRTQTEYEDSFAFKMFLFKFTSYHTGLIYIAFFKGRFSRYPGEDSSNSFEKIRGDTCSPAGCLLPLFFHFLYISLFKYIVEPLIRKMLNWCKRIRSKCAEKDPDSPGFLTSWQHDYNLKQADQLTLSLEYLEMVIQYAFVTLFVVAFPLAPFFALLWNVVKIRRDAQKWTTQLRRPLAERVGDIGAWYGILQGITYTAFVTNAFVIAYTSDIVPRLVYKYDSSNIKSSLQGYVQASLSEYPTARYGLINQKMFKGNDTDKCFHWGNYKTPIANEIAPLEPTNRYYHILAARLAFVAVFEHLAFALTGIMAFAIPDVPREISVQIQREKLLATKVLYESDLARPNRESGVDMADVLSNKTVDARRGSQGARNTFLSKMK